MQKKVELGIDRDTLKAMTAVETVEKPPEISEADELRELSWEGIRNLPNVEKIVTAESVYFGQTKKGLKNGTGILKYHGNRIYEGEWKSDAREGIGCETYANGNYYKGSFKNGKPDGRG